MIKKLYIDTEENKINRNIHSDYYEMYTLYNTLEGMPAHLIESFKLDVADELKNEKSNARWNFEFFQIVILNPNDFLIYDSREDDENIEKTYFFIKQEALWQGIRDYNEIDIYSKKYKRITLSYDDIRVYFDLEPFDTNKD